ncbi:MAG: cell division ATP-binding protein FtsE [Candidatus Schekmanbacteria bacterium RBG_16_38_11]|uniref:Cell division ATP-binding protein FtsE n=2 Tax=Candidatus Schekmaniibacteriota TaxID=1817811 RepID=A0A1F7RAI9_9BACT|nr:MAG: cell division ATP-binding protein FtsE [Candidatus Schekmanbacteria bacterium GWA2_38_11]OGL43885.1 MAG: cell division ATP-binding protein FtsE [Candidatus Schekmanbacteria bacterium RBG_16_38_11]
MIQLLRVDKVYEGGRWALKDINLHIKKEEFVFITGPSGAGKTTILKLIYLGDRATNGQILLFGRNLAILKRNSIPFLRRNMGVVFQDFKLLSDKTVFDNVAFALRILGTRKVELKTRVLETLKLVGLEKRSNEIASMLSGGEQQRVCIARAVVNEPALVLADEPTGNLDLDNANQVMDIFRALNLKGTTVVIATHNREMIEKTGKRTIILDSGNMAGENLPRQGDAL